MGQMLIESMKDGMNRERYLERRARASLDSMRDRTTPYAQEIATLIRVHAECADIYQAALADARKLPVEIGVIDDE